MPIKKHNKNEELDLSKFKKVDPKKVDPDATKTMISLRLDNSLISKLKDQAEINGLPYQTLINSILVRYINNELIDRKSAGVMAAEAFHAIENFKVKKETA